MTQAIAIQRSHRRRNYTFTERPAPTVIDALVRLGYEYDERAQQWWKQEPTSGMVSEAELMEELAAQEAVTRTTMLSRDEHQRRYQSYYTPEAIAQELVELAGVGKGLDCLEPSAGDGEIVRALIEAGGNVVAVEVDPVAFNDLTLHCEARSGDFLTMDSTPGGFGTFDRIVMNPPFSRDQDVRHVCHAWTFLKPGGKLVAIVGSYALNGRTEDRVRFRDLMSRHGRVVRELPPGTFENNARAVIIELVKPSDIRAAA